MFNNIKTKPSDIWCDDNYNDRSTLSPTADCVREEAWSLISTHKKRSWKHLSSDCSYVLNDLSRKEKENNNHISPRGSARFVKIQRRIRDRMNQSNHGNITTATLPDKYSLLELRFVSLDFLVPAARNFLSDKISERYNIHSIRGLTLVVCLVT